ncbi:hypothetical protein LHJ74_02415 [Streptomyces sp. N2-109]|uniref:Integral membrane protein n=1 Tax=Streptomyces gossypii TaxID=2883101 RepID=A0ABT2JLP1_9ACTN|nr:hypothetical protein [Streptomyces gossypii]MCT2588802.1 hypothetical protein [Streptomyces gossypii]
MYGRLRARHLADPPGTAAPTGIPRMPGALVLVLVLVTVHALGTAVGGWAVLDENHSKQDHGQDLLMPMGIAWFVALCCWGLAALQVVCVVLARRRRHWVRVVLAAWLIFVTLSMVLGLTGSLAAGTPSPAVLVILGIDVAALWVVLGETARHWFSVRSPAPISPQG